MKKLIGICGQAQHGKNTISSVLAEEFQFVEVAFADKLKEIALAINPLIQEIAEGFHNTQWYLADVVQDIGWERAKKEYPEVRRFLQRLGTEGMRECVKDSFWIDQHEQTASKYERVSAPDTRFPNEDSYVHMKGGILIRVVRPGFDNGLGDHPSERYVNQLNADYELVNDATVDVLKSKTRALLASIIV